MTKKKSKSMIGNTGERKLAASAGRKKAKSGGEPQKKGTRTGEARARTGSSKQRKS
jgi:hypothetical protein